jgi:hypothetical protein
MSEALKELCRQTGTKPKSWKAVDGPETGVGVEYWFEHKRTGETVYVCDDQGHITIGSGEGDYDTGVDDPT